MSYIQLKDIKKKYPNSDYVSVSDFNLEIEKGEFIVFVGPSGCGKSTTLRMIAGLEDITGGELSIEGNVVNNVSPADRDIAMVFQSYALYPHMDVEQNVTFSMEMKKVAKEERSSKAKWAAGVLQLQDYLKNLPKDLSGGQRQRVALARSIVRDPKVFLMDEPLSNLDAKLRGETRNEILKLHKDLDATIIYVTHDQVEAMTMGDRIVVMSKGLIQQVGKPLELYKRPKNIFVATFLGLPTMNILDGVISGDQLTFTDLPAIKLAPGVIASLNGFEGKVKIGIRPEDFSSKPIEREAYKESEITVKVNHFDFMGSEKHLFSQAGPFDLTIKTEANFKVNVDDELTFSLNTSKLHFFDPANDERIN